MGNAESTSPSHSLSEFYHLYENMVPDISLGTPFSSTMTREQFQAFLIRSAQGSHRIGRAVYQHSTGSIWVFPEKNIAVNSAPLISNADYSTLQNHFSTIGFRLMQNLAPHGLKNPTFSGKSLQWLENLLSQDESIARAVIQHSTGDVWIFDQSDYLARTTVYPNPDYSTYQNTKMY